MIAKSVDGMSTLSRKSLPEFQKMLEDRYFFHKEKADKHIALYKPMGFTFGLAIPVLAAVVTFCMAPESGIPQQANAVMGLGLTLLTIVNSVLKPHERFNSASQHCIALHEWKRDYDIELAEIDATDEIAFHARIREMDNKLSEIGKAMAESYIPKAAA